ncbi:serine/threonine-protein kinase RsbW [Algoriphagus aquimarinus]|uniref:Serine/threonine-protein kinase RsbW n=2 Tax=Algoriphagus aquimarinus TaxID=237018 RepID=A0A1I0VN42_9BACT|nr:serine/threonine-protein kinase RsbW [Algoriphagus aquimarinus]|tara:strand:+ start:276158 stop:276562 length:405 start_codon:yes stop_codon:yes gene_type:complete
MMKTIKISIPSLIENIKIIESFIDNARENFEINDDIYGNIMISVTECISNAIIHGNQGDKNKLVHLELTLEEELLLFTIQDEGEGFDYNLLKDPTAPENIEKIGGRGIFLIKHLSDDVKFEENGTKTVLSFYMN